MTNIFIHVSLSITTILKNDRKKCRTLTNVKENRRYF